MNPFCLVSTVQASDGGDIFLAHLKPLSTNWITTAYLSIFGDHVHSLKTTVYLSSDSFFQKDSTPCHKTQMISNWFLQHDNAFTVVRWPPEPPDLNPIEHLQDVLERESHIMGCAADISVLRHVIISKWNKISEEGFQYLVKCVWLIINCA